MLLGHSLCLHMGHCPLDESCLIHSMMQCFVFALVNSQACWAIMRRAGTDHMEVVAAFSRHYRPVLA